MAKQVGVFKPDKSLPEEIRAIYRAMFIHLCDRKPAIILPELLEELERLAITCALSYCHGNFAAAARVLGVKRTTLVEMRRRLGLPIKPPRAMSAGDL